ncbi:hypothetical protein POTOM_050499 [Populus tomentosa]|uniref:Protein kinase domain-containing protein n=1 Tax=Populus tomentosa TaxID=118781 RepID=A0A8X8CAT4_POPTO|nr:hypothetical protein POTOM_050499 [Populus tomentosa]
MDRILIWVLPILMFFILPKSNSEDENVTKALVQFMEKLSAGNSQNNQNWGWDRSSDPCIGNVNFNGTWKGVDCLKSQNVKKIVLDKFNLTGTFDAASVCTAKFLVFLSLKENNISGFMPKEIGNCGRLRHLYVSGNRFAGDIPDTFPQLRNLKSIDISENNFSGELPTDMSRISGLLTFFAENNQLSGEIPDFEFSFLKDFNVANNNFSGPIPDFKGKFGADSFSGNRSEYSIASVEAGMTSSSLEVLPSPVVNGLKLEDLLRAPAELLGRGNHGSLYKIMFDNATILAVKRIKDWGISAVDFKRRMEMIDQVRHPRVLPPVAFYCSEQEKLLVYEYQQNGSLFKLLHGHDQSFLSQSDSFKSNASGGDGAYSTFKVDVYGFSVVLLELLTGKLVENNGFDLASWVREEWTAEVFDRALISEGGASEERMVSLLQVALKCINPSPNERPAINQISAMINTIKEDEERSIISEP